MKGSSASSSSFVILIIITLHALSTVSIINGQQTDSCSSNLNLNSLPFDATSLNCLAVWESEGFILRYAQAASNLWSFVLSAPDPNSYVAVGFSSNGRMIGSSAMVGWISSDGNGTVKQYYLGGQAPSLVEPDQGNLQVVDNSSTIISQSSRLYLAFQLNTNQPLSRVLYAFGRAGALPSSPDFALTEHSDKVSTYLDYVTGQTKSENRPEASLRKSHGLLNMLGWGILMIIGTIAARCYKELDPIWFYSHAMIQSMGFILGVAGVICGFVLENRLSIDVSTHKGLGLFILSLGCLQVLALFARPYKEAKLRKYWNWYHHTLGRTLIIFAISNVFYGIHLGGGGKGWSAAYGIVLGILLIIAIVLEIRRIRK